MEFKTKKSPGDIEVKKPTPPLALIITILISVLFIGFYFMNDQLWKLNNRLDSYDQKFQIAPNITLFDAMQNLGMNLQSFDHRLRNIEFGFDGTYWKCISPFQNKTQKIGNTTINSSYCPEAVIVKNFTISSGVNLSGDTY